MPPTDPLEDLFDKPAPRPRQSGLDPQFQTQVDEILNSLKQRGFSARLSEGYRTPEKQNEYYAQGRTRPGPIVTNARGSVGRHTHGMAADIDLLDASGRPLPSNDPNWKVLGEEASRRGLTWGGAWRRLKDSRHVESRRGGQAQRPTSRNPPDDLMDKDPLSDLFDKDSGQNLPPPTSKSKTRRPTKIPVTPAVAPSVPKTVTGSSNIGELRRLEGEQARHEQQLRTEAKRELQSRRGSYGSPTLKGMLHLAADPVGSFTGIFKSDEQKLNEMVQERLRAESVSREPEVTAIRKEYGQMSAPKRSAIAPLARGGAGILKLASGISSLGGYLPKGVVPPADKLSEWANRRAEIIESGAANTPLTEKEEEITRGVPEKVLTGFADLGVGLGEIILLKRATKLSFPQLLALEGALKNSDKPISEQAGRAAEGYALGSALDAHLGRTAGAALFGLPTAAQAGYEVSEGRMSPLDAAIQTGIQAGAGAILSPSRKRGQVERQFEAQPDVTAQPDLSKGANKISAETSPEQTQHFYHKDWGEVEVLADQSGANKGKVKVAEVADPTKIHFPRRSDLRGRGNERMVPLVREPEIAPDPNLEVRSEKPNVLDRETQKTSVIPPDQPAQTELLKPPEQIATSTLRRSEDLTAAGLKPDLSLSQFVRKMGGIAPSEAHRGEMDRIRLRETGTTGLINGKAKQGNVKQTADIIMQSANDAGYRDPKTGRPFENPGDFLYAVERDVLGDKIRVRTGEEDFSAAEAEYYTEQESRIRAAESRNTFLESGRGAELFDRIVDRKASDAARAEYTELAEKAGISRAESADLIAASREEVADLQRTGREGPTTPPRPAEQLGFVQEGLTQQEAPPPRLTQPDPADLTPQTRKMQLDEIKRRGMTVDDYARQPDLMGNVPSAEEVATLRGLEGAPQGKAIELDAPVPDDVLRIVNRTFNQMVGPDISSQLPKKPTTQDVIELLADVGLSDEIMQESVPALRKAGYSRIGNVLITEEGLRLAPKELESGQLNFGPGTMRAGEPLPEVKERKFGKRFVEDERIAEEIRESIGTAKYYEPIPEKVTAVNARDLINKRGIAESMRIIRDEKNDIPFHVRSVMSQIVQLRLNQAYRNLRDSNPKDAELVLNQANEMAEHLMEFGTRLGQGVQSFAQWARQTPEGILLTYKRIARESRERQRKLFDKDVGEIVKTLNREGITDAERVQALKDLFGTNKTAKKVRSEFDKILEAARSGKLTDTLFYEIVGDKLGLPSYNKETAAKITDLALRIQAAPEGLPKDKLLYELATLMATEKGFDPGDLPLGIFYTHILSGYNTHAVNIADTGFNVIAEMNNLAMVEPRAAAWIYSGYLRGINEGRFDALLAFTKGRMFRESKWLDTGGLMEVAKFGQKGGVPIKTVTRAGRVAKKVAESKIAIPLNAYKFVGRAMAAADAVNARAASEARANLLAYRVAKAEGLTGAGFESRVREILALGRDAEFQKIAEGEGFTGAELKYRTRELRDLMRDKDLMADAAEFAGEATYNHKPHGTLGFFAEQMRRASNVVKPLKVFVPFTQIVANVTNRGLNWTPYGYKRALAGWGYGPLREPVSAETRRAMLTRATAGTVGLVLLGVMQESGLLAIHGNGPSDREKRRQLQSAGWRPYTLQIGDTYISYQYSPVGLGLSIIGNMKDAGRYHELEQKDAATKGAYAVARLGSTIFSQSFLSGLSRLFAALSERPDVSVNAVKQTLGGTAAAFTTPNIVRDIHRLFDNKAYQSNTLMEDLVRSTPFAALALKPQLNAFGEPVKLQRQRFVDKLTSDPAWRFVIQKGLRVPVPGRTTEMEDGKRITPEQYYQLLQKTGPEIKQWILDNQQNLQLLPEQDAQDELQSAATAIRKRALDEMRGKIVKPLKPPAPPKPEAPARP